VVRDHEHRDPHRDQGKDRAAIQPLARLRPPSPDRRAHWATRYCRAPKALTGPSSGARAQARTTRAALFAPTIGIHSFASRPLCFAYRSTSAPPCHDERLAIDELRHPGHFVAETLALPGEGPLR